MTDSEEHLDRLEQKAKESHHALKSEAEAHGHGHLISDAGQQSLDNIEHSLSLIEDEEVKASLNPLYEQFKHDLLTYLGAVTGDVLDEL